MAGVVTAHGRRANWMVRRPGVAAELAGPLLVGTVLGLAAITESVVRAAVTGVSVQRALVLCLVALASTLPPALVSRAAAATIVVTASAASIALFHTLTVAALLAVLFVLYRSGRAARPGRTARTVAASLPFVFLVLALIRLVPAGSETGVLTVLLASLAPVAAVAGLARRARAESARHDAAREAVAGDLLAFTARGERARIARELHDVVAHHISMIAVQSETARLTTPGMPPVGAQRLLAIGDTARSALTEMRRLLGVLREDADLDAPDLRPQPSLQQLNELLDEARDASGSAARLILSGAPAGLDPGVELAAYRIVQEALTNARRHAPGAAVDVELHYGQRALSLKIRDNGPGLVADAVVAGHGLTGMRERAIAVGGRLQSGPTATGGFLVEATLPTVAVEIPA